MEKRAFYYDPQFTKDTLQEAVQLVADVHLTYPGTDLEWVEINNEAGKYHVKACFVEKEHA